MAYAEGTAVQAERSKAEVEKMLKKAGATSYFTMEDQQMVMVGCRMMNRFVRFKVPLPDDEWLEQRYVRAKLRQEVINREVKRRWRCLVLAIKAKLTVVESGISTFEEEFLSNIVVDQKTVYEHIAHSLEETYKTGKPMPLMLGSASEEAP